MFEWVKKMFGLSIKNIDEKKDKQLAFDKVIKELKETTFDMLDDVEEITKKQENVVSMEVSLF